MLLVSGPISVDGDAKITFTLVLLFELSLVLFAWTDFSGRAEVTKGFKPALNTRRWSLRDQYLHLIMTRSDQSVDHHLNIILICLQGAGIVLRRALLSSAAHLFALRQLLRSSKQECIQSPCQASDGNYSPNGKKRAGDVRCGAGARIEFDHESLVW